AVVDVRLGNRVFQGERLALYGRRRRDAAAPLGEQHVGNRVFLQGDVAHVGDRDRVGNHFARGADGGLVGRFHYCDGRLLIAPDLFFVRVGRLTGLLSFPTRRSSDLAVVDVRLGHRVFQGER